MAERFVPQTRVCAVGSERDPVQYNRWGKRGNVCCKRYKVIGENLHKDRVLIAALTLPLAVVSIASSSVAQTAEATTKAAIARVRATDPKIHAVIALDPTALDQARAIDGRKGAHGLLYGYVILIKDNIESDGPLPTTAGSMALLANVTHRDAPLVARLRAAGAVILGKTNLSEWANIRSSSATSGWSAVGGLTKNPHATDRTACGSSSGSGAAVAVGMAWAAIGTETDGSVTCPASINGIVGLKPTVGLVSRTYVVPISASQDTPGPMARSVADAALLLNAIAGPDPADKATAASSAHMTDFTAGLDTASLKGKRIGVLRKLVGNDPRVTKLFDSAVADLKRADKRIVTATRTWGVSIIRFGQDLFEQAETIKPATYKKVHAENLRLAGPEGIDKLLAANKVSLLIAPTVGPAWTTDMVNGDHYNASIGATSLAAIAGYPHLTVPMGAVEGLPVGLSFIGAKWADHALLLAGAAYERARTAKLPVPSLKPWAPAGD